MFYWISTTSIARILYQEHSDAGGEQPEGGGEPDDRGPKDGGEHHEGRPEGHGEHQQEVLHRRRSVRPG